MRNKKYTGSPSLKWLFEQAPAAAPAPAAGAQNPEQQKAKIADINSINKNTNIADVDPKAIVTAMQNPEANPNIIKIIEKPAEEIKALVAKIGPDELAKRIGEIGAKLPSTGLPKNEMPFLPATDIKDWNDSEAVSKMIDAVSPGGEYQVDFNAPFYDMKSGAEKTAEAGKGSESTQQQGMQEAAQHKLLEMGVKKLAEMLNEEEGPASVAINTLNTSPSDAEEWLKAGVKDGKTGDDEPAVAYQDQAPLTINKMVPTQKNVLIGKSLNFAVGNYPTPGTELGAYVVDAGNGIEILDGHHRWAGGYLLDPNMNLTGHLFKSSIPTRKLLPILTRLGNALGKPTKTDEAFKRVGSLIREAAWSIDRWQVLAGIKRG